MPKTDDENLHLMSQNKSADVLKFHQSFPQYSETPLVQLRSLAARFSSLTSGVSEY